MSTCISRHGEFGAHTLDDSHTCTLCHVLDEEALRAELERLRAALVRAEGLVEATTRWREGLPVDAAQWAVEADRELAEAVDLYSATDSTPEERDEWLVWSVYHSGWWGPAERGYFSDLAKAGRYPREQAERICAYGGSKGWSADGQPSEVMVPVPAQIGAVDAARQVADEVTLLVDEATKRFSRPVASGS